MVEEIMTQTSTDARIGAAYAAVNVWAETHETERLSKFLERIIRTSDKYSWAATIDLFRLVDEITPDPAWIRVLRAIADKIPSQPVFSSSFIVERLQTLLPHNAELVAKITNELVEKWNEELGDLRTRTASSAPELVDIAITLHRLGPHTREEGLRLFENLLTINAYSAKDTLDQIDNRFRDTPSAVRRKLPRRNRRRSRRLRRKV